MNLAQFEELLDQFGGDLSLWPADKAAEAEQLLSSSPSARQSIDSQKLVERRLTEILEPPPSLGLERRIVERWRNSLHKRWVSNWFGVSWKPTLAATCALAFGLYLGAMDQTFPIELEDDVAAVMFYDYVAANTEVNDGT